MEHEITKCSLHIYCHLVIPTQMFDVVEGIYEICTAKPQAGVTFYLLGRSAEEILRENKDAIWAFPPGKPDLCRPDADKIVGKYINEILRDAERDQDKYLAALLHLAALVSDITPLTRAGYLAAMEVLSIRAIRAVRTDRQGMAKIEDLRTGTYYVCGVSVISLRSWIWNVRVDLKPGENSLTLNNHNTMGMEVGDHL